jgi:hypothetical protein
MARCGSTLPRDRGRTRAASHARCVQRFGRASYIGDDREPGFRGVPGLDRGDDAAMLFIGLRDDVAMVKCSCRI